MAPDVKPGRPRPPLQERSAQRQRTVVEAVQRLFDRGESPSSITIDEICVEAEVSRSSFYLRWPSKDAMWGDLAEAYTRDAMDDIEGTRVELEHVPDLAEFGERVGVAYGTWMFEHRAASLAFAGLALENSTVAATMSRFNASLMDLFSAEVSRRVGLESAMLPMREHKEMIRLVEMLLSTVQRACAPVREGSELRSMPRDEFIEWFGSISRRMAELFEAAVETP